MSIQYLVEVFEHLLSCGWAYGFTLTPLPPQMLPHIWESWLKSYLIKVCKPCHYALFETVEPLKLHPMSMSYIHERFEHLLRLWMGIWLHTHTITTTDAPPDFRELAEILPFASLQTMPLRFGWGCRTFQSASLIYEIHSLGFWVPSQVVGGHMASHSHHYHHRHFPRFEKVGWNQTSCKSANHATTFWLRLWNLSNCIPCPCHTYMRCLSTFSGCGWAYGLGWYFLFDRNLFFGLKNKKTQDSWVFSVFFPEDFFTGTWFWRGLRNSCFQPFLQDFFAGILAGQEFLYFHQITPDSFGFLRILAGFLFLPKLSGFGQPTNSPQTSSPSSKPTTNLHRQVLTSTPSSPPNLFYSVQYHILLQLNLKSKT